MNIIKNNILSTIILGAFIFVAIGSVDDDTSSSSSKSSKSNSSSSNMDLCTCLLDAQYYNRNESDIRLPKWNPVRVESDYEIWGPDGKGY